MHTPEFIQEMKTVLEEEQALLDKEIAAINTFPEYGRNDEDNVTEVADYQAAASTEVTLQKRLIDVKDALERIKQGTYGSTTDGETIPQDRLRANPAATNIIK